MSFITLQEAKDWLGITDTSKDTIIQDLVDTVSETIEDWCEVKFSPTVVTNEIHDARRTDIVIPEGYPLISVQQIVINVQSDGSGGAVIDPSTYTKDDQEIRLRYLVLPLQRSYFRIDYTHGYASVPKKVKLAAKLSVEAYYRMRGRQSVGLTSKSKEGESVNYKGAWDAEAGLPKEAISLLKKYRRLEFPTGLESATRNW